MNILKKLWLTLSTPSKAGVGLVLALGFVGGVVFWGGFNTTLSLTNTEEFCTGCHEMADNVYQE